MKVLSLLTATILSAPAFAADVQPVVIDIGQGTVGMSGQLQIIHLHSSKSLPLDVPKGIELTGPMTTDTITLNDGSVVDKDTYPLKADAVGEYLMTMKYVDAKGVVIHITEWHCVITDPSQAAPQPEVRP